MVSLVVTEMTGEIPRRDQRLLPNNAAAEAWNVDLSSGTLVGLPVPAPVWDFKLLPGQGNMPVIRRAHFIPNPGTAEPGDTWLALPSPYSSVVRSPLANDAWFRTYWTNPGEGGFYNVFSSIYNQFAHYNLGYIPPYPAPLTITSEGGNLPVNEVVAWEISQGGVGGQVGDQIIVQGGTLQNSRGPAIFGIETLQVNSVQPGQPGQLVGVEGQPNTIPEDGLYEFYSTTHATGVPFRLYMSVVNGQAVAVEDPHDRGQFPGNPYATPVSHAPVKCDDLPQLIGVTVIVGIGPRTLVLASPGGYLQPPPNPVGFNALGIAANLSYEASGEPEIERSYVYTYVDAFGQESNPSPPSNVVAGASNGRWVVYGLPVTPPNPTPGKTYAPVRRVRVYRTTVGTGAVASYYLIAEYSAENPPPNVAFGAFVDAVTDTTAAMSPVLETATWAPPPEGLDGLTALPGGMLVGFTKNTIHFCEPNRPHAWPPAYDLSVQHDIVALAAWNGSLVVLTKGAPSQGSGNTPGSFVLQTAQIWEPCVSRGSVVSDPRGVIYAGPNGLMVLNGTGIQSLTDKLIDRVKWRDDYRATSLRAARHRDQYIAVNDRGSGLIVDFSDERGGLVRLNCFAYVESIWNDTNTGDAYFTVGKKIFRWDELAGTKLVYRWRSKKFVSPNAVNLGACTVSLTDDVYAARNIPGTRPETDDGDPRLTIPIGKAAVFRLFRDEGVLCFERGLSEPRETFRLPSGFRTNTYQIEVVSRTPITRIEVASTMRELGNV